MCILLWARYKICGKKKGDGLLTIILDSNGVDGKLYYISPEHLNSNYDVSYGRCLVIITAIFIVFLKTPSHTQPSPLALERREDCMRCYCIPSCLQHSKMTADICLLYSLLPSRHRETCFYCRIPGSKSSSRARFRFLHPTSYPMGSGGSFFGCKAVGA